MGKSQRTKGHNFEREIAQDLQTHGFPKARRHLEYQSEEAKGVDLTGTESFVVQCKCMKKVPNIPQVMETIATDDVHEIKVVVFRVSGKGTFAAFKWKDALLLMSAFKAL